MKVGIPTTSTRLVSRIPSTLSSELEVVVVVAFSLPDFNFEKEVPEDDEENDEKDDDW